MRATLICLTACLLAGCDFRENRNSASLVSSSGGEVALADGGSLEFAITSEQYKRWDRARRGIDRRIAARFGEILQPDSPTERSISEAVAYLESEPGARNSIEKAGMSVRGFVVMTVALEQEMRLASGQPAIRQPEPTTSPYDFPQFDTTLIQPTPSPYPVPVDTYRVDTARPFDPRDTMTRVMPPPSRDTQWRQTPTIFRRDTIRRDTVRRDTVRRDTVRRDTVRRDTVRRDTVRPDTARHDTTKPPPAPPPVIRDTLADTTKGPVVPPDTLRPM